MNQRKCNHCGTWSNATHDHCTNCGKLINEAVLRAEEKKIKEEKELSLSDRIKKPDWLDRFFEKADYTNNPYYKLMAAVLRGIWAVYFGIMLFIMWFIFWAAG